MRIILALCKLLKHIMPQHIIICFALLWHFMLMYMTLRILLCNIMPTSIIVFFVLPLHNLATMMTLCIVFEYCFAYANAYYRTSMHIIIFLVAMNVSSHAEHVLCNYVYLIMNCVCVAALSKVLYIFYSAALF